MNAGFTRIYFLKMLEVSKYKLYLSQVLIWDRRDEYVGLFYL